MVRRVPSERALRRARPRHPLHARFATEQAVYGVLLVSGIIVAAGAHGATATSVLLTLVPTVVVFWAAHVYAGAVSQYGDEDDVGLRGALRQSLRRAWGLLLVSLVPAAILLLGTARIVDDTLAIWAALWTGVVLLGVLGYLAFRRRGASWPIRILGTLTTAAFGVVAIVLKALIH